MHKVVSLGVSLSVGLCIKLIVYIREAYLHQQLKVAPMEKLPAITSYLETVMTMISMMLLFSISQIASLTPLIFRPNCPFLHSQPPTNPLSGIYLFWQRVDRTAEVTPSFQTQSCLLFCVSSRKRMTQ